jgi:putative ATP-binding cassette transporter
MMSASNPATPLGKFAAFRQFCGRVLALSSPYFKSEDKWKARGLLLAIVVLNLAAVYMLVLLNDWNRVFYDALQNKNQPVFWTQLGRFTYLAFAFIIIAVYRFYLTQLLQVRWRAWMTASYLERWLAGHAFYTLELARFSGGDKAAADNPDQRIQEDINLFTTYSVSLSMGLLNAIVTLVSFVGILWSLSGAFSVTLGGSSYVIPGFMVWLAVLYCVVGSIITHYIGRPQIKLNFLQQRYEADFRHHMVRVREYSEAIALDKGENVERAQIDLRFSHVLANYITLIKKQKNLVWFTNFFGQAAVVFPFIVAAPRFFSGAIQLGELMQIASAFGRVQDSLGWLVDNYSSLAAWRATTDRLTSFEDNIVLASQQVRAKEAINSGAPVASADINSDALSARNLTISLPNGKVLLSGVTLDAAAGDTILFKGPSGSGKSTLFRAFGNIWPFASGQSHLPPDTMFIPQRPYFPDGPLRDALAYPHPVSQYTDDALRQALVDALLPQLSGRLDDQDAWGQKLSGGEQQRLAIARVLLKKPKWIFADEATAALDESAEKTLYAKLRSHVQSVQGGMVSIAHRPSVAAFHNRQWELLKQPDGAAAQYSLAESTLPTTSTNPDR